MTQAASFYDEFVCAEQNCTINDTVARLLGACTQRRAQPMIYILQRISLAQPFQRALSGQGAYTHTNTTALQSAQRKRSSAVQYPTSGCVYAINCTVLQLTWPALLIR
jgi:hypothetical protein